MKIRTVLIVIAIGFGITLISLWMGQVAYSWMPVEATAEAKLIDDVFSLFVELGTFIFLGITGILMYSIFFHRAGKYDYSDGPPIEGNVTLEIVWTAIPIVLVFILAGYSYQNYEQMAIRGPMELVHFHNPLGMQAAYADSQVVSEPPEAIEVQAKQWAWSFHYPEQDVTTAELHLPVNHRVRLSMQTEDVIHGFYIPAFRLKQDIIPKRTIDFEFTPVREGRYRLNDSQFSGAYFAVMEAPVFVESPDNYHQWLDRAARSEATPAYNQAYSEYTQSQEKGFGGWVTTPPAPPPLVNQPS